MESKTIKKSKHVIILGAGASATSGYPVGNDLRLWMSSPKALREKIESVLDKASDSDRVLILKQFDEWIKPVERALQLFREGDFASVDEFCRLAGTRLQNEVSQLKKVLRLALSIQNPEDHYELSDYYGFIQRLFLPNLVDMREDVVVLSFNYDVYLEFLLQRAVRVREHVTKGKSQTALDLFTSGFSNRNVQQIESSDEFCLLKLHGAVAWPNLTCLQGAERDDYSWHGDLFYENSSSRLRTLTSHGIGQSDSPIVFPWEVMDDNGNFINEDVFPCYDRKCSHSRFPGGYNGTTTLFQLFKSIWIRARAEVLAAAKISIIGLSMHEYLKPAFKFLFSGKSGNVVLVVADKSLQKFAGKKESDAHFDPLTPVARIDQLLRELCPELRWNETEIPEGFPQPPPVARLLTRMPIKLHASFEDFILNELGTQAKYEGVIQTG